MSAVEIARCPEHGLHGERTECFVCGGPVEQVPMMPVSEHAALMHSQDKVEPDVSIPSVTYERNHHPEAEVIARALHETAERIAPEWDFEVTSIPWSDLSPMDKGVLMATVTVLLERGVIRRA